MPHHINTEVLIVGAGPVGLSLAMDLTQRGVGVTLAEMRAAGEPPSVRCNHVSARTMEIYRRFGIAGIVREAGLPADYPNDVAFRTTATGVEMARIPIPCRAARYTAKHGPDTWWPTPEPPHRINQIYLEPVLFACATATRGLRILNRTRVLDFEQHENRVFAIAEDLDANEHFQIFARYLIGCDGAHSEIRHRIGTLLSGDARVMRVQSTDIIAPDLLQMMASPAWAIDCLNPRSWGLMFAIDGRKRWIIHNFLPAVERDRSIRDILGVGSSFEFTILAQEDWTGRRMIADRFRDRRVFLCGDAAHIWVPFAGYGMNAGIADAMSLSWMLAGVIKGWADPALLDAYEIERQPITDQVSHYAMNTALARASQRSTVPDTIEQVGPEGDAVRARIGREAYDINVGQFCCGGLNFGYFYAGSPIIAYDGEPAPPYTIDQFSQSTVPGCRTPHLWLRDGRSLYDVMSSDFTLLRFDPRIEIGEVVRAAVSRNVPMAVVDVDAEEAAAHYPCKLLLSRPDQHVAWRGNDPPSDPMALIDRVRGGSAERSNESCVDHGKQEVPSLVDVWRVDPSAFTEALAAGNVGLLLGSTGAGLIGDRVGRKPVLICCVTLFGVFSLLSAFVVSPLQLASLRLLTGLGLGGGIPLAIALVSDRAPVVAQGRLVILMSAGVPIGFTLGGLAASQTVPVFGWPAIFVLGGVLPLALVPLLALRLPESIAMSATVRRRNLVAALFRDGHASKTALLWAMNLLNLVSNFLILLWTPAVLHGGGASSSQATFATSMFGLGIILGALLTASVVDRLGVERVLTYTVAFGALCMLSLGSLQPHFSSLSVIICGAGIGIGGCQAGLKRIIGKDLSSAYPLDWSRLGFGPGARRRHCRTVTGRRAAGARRSGEGHLRCRRDPAPCRDGVDGDPRAIAAQ